MKSTVVEVPSLATLIPACPGFKKKGLAHVKLDVMDASGRVIDSVDLGAMASGRHTFDWTPPPGVDPNLASRFRVSGALGTTAVTATAYTRDRVDAVSTGPDGLVLELANAGPVAYDKVKAFD